MLCDRCGKNVASVYVKQIINNKENIEHLCEDCAGKFFNVGNLHLDKLFSTESDFDDYFDDLFNKNAITCPLCGMTYREYQKSGRLGCARCYEVFAKQLAPAIKKLHGHSKHLGKSLQTKAKPDYWRDTIKPDVTIDQSHELQLLKDEMIQLVSAENFEQAAVVRDQIKQIELELASQVK